MIDRLKTRLAREESGFTLIELLVVIIILGILLAIAVPSYLGLRDRADKTAAASNVRAILPDVEQFYSDNGTYAGIENAATGTPPGLVSYDQSIDTTKVKFVGVAASGATPSTYKLCAKSGGWYATKDGPSGQITSTQTAPAAPFVCP